MDTQFKIIPVRAFKDNYIWLITHPNKKHALVVDPGDAVPVLTALKQLQLTPSAILITHYHWDHTNGIEKLLEHYPELPVFGPTKEMPGISNPVTGGDSLTWPELGLTFEVVDIPGHTLGHIAYYGHRIVFCGDTLFTGGCGRIFEGTASQLYQSLLRLAKLPDETNVYCGHEYTESNLRFAHAVEPHNPSLQQRIQDTQALRRKDLPTVPATLQLEKQTNPFLRCMIPEVKTAAENYAKQSLENPLAVFTALREWKNKF